MIDRHAQHLEQLTAEERYHRQRLELYRARLYGGRAVSRARLEEYQRAADNAAARLTAAYHDRGAPPEPRASGTVDGPA